MNERFNIEKIFDLSKKYGIRISPPVNEEVLEHLNASIGELPKDLNNLYKLTNGLEGETFKILSILNPKDPSNTWDSIERANQLDSSRFSINPEILNRFIIFSEIGSNYAGLIEKETHKIWFEDEEGWHETDLSITEFIEALIKDEI